MMTAVTKHQPKKKRSDYDPVFEFDAPQQFIDLSLFHAHQEIPTSSSLSNARRNNHCDRVTHEAWFQTAHDQHLNIGARKTQLVKSTIVKHFPKTTSNTHDSTPEEDIQQLLRQHNQKLKQKSSANSTSYAPRHVSLRGIRMVRHRVDHMLLRYFISRMYY